MENGTAVTLARFLTPIPVGVVDGTRTRKTLIRKRPQVHISWARKNLDGVPLPGWVDVHQAIVIPDVDAAGDEARTVPSVIVEEIARALEDGEFDDVEVPDDPDMTLAGALAQALRKKYLLS